MLNWNSSFDKKRQICPWTTEAELLLALAENILLFNNLNYATQSPL